MNDKAKKGMVVISFLFLQKKNWPESLDNSIVNKMF